jgi:hypothetical protein
MEDNMNKDTISQQMNDTARSPESLQVPPSLLPAVLHRLGLMPEQAQQELSLEEAVVKLKSSDWEERAMAVRLLGKRAEVPGELLESALDDEDGAVRAAAVHAMGKRAPLHRLMRALYDADWHVRETAVFVLGQQRPHVPDEMLKTALHDTDHAVREAARYVLQQHVSPVEGAVIYGQLQEKKRMQQDNDTVQMANWEDPSSYETVPPLALREQAQAYAPQEQIPYGYGADTSSREKVTSVSMRRSSKKWWIILPIVALCFFIMGALSVSHSSHSLFGQTGTSSVAVNSVQEMPEDTVSTLLQNTKYKNMLAQEMSNKLNLTQKQIMIQLQMGKSMTDIATTQGISPDQLRTIETGAFVDTLRAMVQASNVSQSEADAWQVSNLSTYEQMDKWTSMIFMPPPAPNGK